MSTAPDHAEARLLQSESQTAAAAEDVECGSFGHHDAAEASTLGRLGGGSESGRRGGTSGARLTAGMGWP